MRRAAWLVVVLVVAACGRRGAEEDVPAAAASGLVTSLDVRLRGDTADLALLVANALAEPQELEYATSQRYDFAIYAASGEEVWRWSADRQFAQVTSLERLGAGEMLEHREEWAASVAPGRYIAEGRLVALNRAISLRTAFEVPAR